MGEAGAKQVKGLWWEARKWRQGDRMHQEGDRTPLWRGRGTERSRIEGCQNLSSRLHDVTGGGRVPERATTSKPKRKAGVDPAAAQGREVPSKPSTFSGVV